MPGLAWHVGQATTPLRVALDDPTAMEDLLARLGWRVMLDDDAATTIDGLLDVASALAIIAEQLDVLIDADADAAAQLQAAAAVMDAAVDIVAAIGDVAAVSSADVAALPAPLDDPATWGLLATELPLLLATDHLRRHLGVLYAVLGLVGVLAPPSDVRTPTDERLELHVDRLFDLVADPGALLTDVTGWGDKFDHLYVRWWLHEFADAVGMRLDTVALPQPVADDVYGGDRPDHDAVALELIDTTVAEGDAALTVDALLAPLGTIADPAGDPVGLYVGPRVWGSVEGEITLPGSWVVHVATAVDASGLSGLSIRPGAIAHETSAPAPSGSIDLEQLPTDPIELLGSGGIALRSHGVSVGLAIDDLEPSLVVAAIGGGLELVIGADETDPLMRAVLGAADVTVSLPLELQFSRSGIRLGGGVGFSVSLGLDLTIGPFTVRDVDVGLVVTGGALVLEGTVEIAGELGPFAVVVAGFGANVTLVPGDDDLGVGVVVDGGLVPPNELAFSIEAAGISGGGILYVEQDRYIGGLSLDLTGIGVDALTVIDTSLPGDPDGFALFASLGLRFPSVPLGFGFSLSGLGGILALNRTVDAEALALGLRDGAADVVLFPDDAVRDAELIVDQLDQWFPIHAGNTVVGPVAEVSWGVADMVTGQLGIVVSLPDGVIVVLGSLEAVFPDPAAPVLELHLDTLGALDLAEGTLLVVASLYDSRLLGTIELSGDGALYVSISDDPYFVLSVGGFHPGFQPPGHAPAVLGDLRRMRAEVVVGLGVTAVIEAYLAVTSNTVQFGGAFELEAVADVALVSYTARGWFSFDVLVRFSPFRILADASAGVGVYANDKELMGVELSAHLEGPEPWFATGTARFTFFGVKVAFDITVGTPILPLPPPPSDVLADVLLELSAPTAWTMLPSPSGAILTLAEHVPQDAVRPDDSLVGRQTTAPFDHPLERYGETTPAQDRIELTAATLVDPATGDPIGDLDVTDHLDWFAPAQFTTMRDTERLSAPSYELLEAGVRIGSEGVALPGGARDRLDVPAGHETEVWEPDRGLTVAHGQVIADRATADGVAASAAATALRRTSRPTVAVDRVVVDQATYVVVDVRSAAPRTTTTSYAQALRDRDGRATRVVLATAAAAGRPT